MIKYLELKAEASMFIAKSLMVSGFVYLFNILKDKGDSLQIIASVASFILAVLFLNLSMKDIKILQEEH